MKRNKDKLSIDRFEEDCSNVEYLCAIHDAEAPRRDSQTFYGWHYLKASVIREGGSEVEPSPRKGADDDWHADVVVSDSDQIEKVCSVIASEAAWYERP